MFSFREFAFQCYRLINASSPTVPLHGDDEQLALTVTNQLLGSYASTGLLITIAKTVETIMVSGQSEVHFTDRNFQNTTTYSEVVNATNGSNTIDLVDASGVFVGDDVQSANLPPLTRVLGVSGNNVLLSAPFTATGLTNVTFTHDDTPPNVAFIKEGRLANLQSAWLMREGVTYPLIQESSANFLSAFKYEPLKGLPRFVIVYPETEITRVRLYPALSQGYTFFARGKFNLSTLTKDSDMNLIPDYFRRFLLFATARDLSMYKGRADAWTQKLQLMLDEARLQMESTSEVNLTVTGETDALLNGAWRVRAGV